MSNSQHFNFASDFEQQSAVTTQASHWGFLIQYLKEEEIIPFEEWISKLNKDTATKVQSIAHGFIHQKQMFTDHTAADELTLMRDTLQSNMKKCLQELKEE
eukprot:15366452-Ditylum_brightwellii.AAC.1